MIHTLLLQNSEFNQYNKITNFSDTWTLPSHPGEWVFKYSCVITTLSSTKDGATVITSHSHNSQGHLSQSRCSGPFLLLCYRYAYLCPSPWARQPGIIAQQASGPPIPVRQAGPLFVTKIIGNCRLQYLFALQCTVHAMTYVLLRARIVNLHVSVKVLNSMLSSYWIFFSSTTKYKLP